MFLLEQHVGERGLGHVLESSAGYDLPSGDTLEPDVSFISNARYEAGPPPERGRFLPIVPDLVIEVLSDFTAARDRTEKKAIYATDGVDEYWLVDTDAREIKVFCRDGAHFGGEERFRTGTVSSGVLSQMVITVEDVFRRIA